MQKMQLLIDKLGGECNLLSTMNKPASRAGRAGHTRNALPRRNPGAAITTPERSG